MSVLDAVSIAVPVASERVQPPPARDGDAKPSLRRAVSLVATVGLFWPLLKAWDDIVSVPSAGIATVAATGAALVLACTIAAARTDEALDRLDRWLLALGLLVLFAGGATALQQGGGYGTDEAAFVQGAANLLIHGHNPYGANLLTSLSQYAVPSQFWTYTMNGGVVSTLGYPALPVLIAVPFVELTGGGQAVSIANLAVLMLATVAMFKVLPRGWKPLAVVVCVGFPTLAGFAIAGDNAVLMMAALVIAAYRWRAVGQRGALTGADKVKAVSLGLALSTNQLAWFLAPFLISGLYLARRIDLGPRRGAAVTFRYAGLAAATFAVINAPFIAMDPLAWLHGVTAPLGQHALPYGQGVVGLTLFLRVGGGAIDAYSYAAALLYVALLAVYVLENQKLARCCFVFPAIALFASGRSLSGYWMSLIAVVVVGVATTDDWVISRWIPASDPRPSARLKKVWICALFVPAAVFLAIALATPQPLAMRILHAHSNPALRTVDQLTVEVQNRSGDVLSPHFSTDAHGQASPFWKVARGPASLAPGAEVVYTLTASEADSMPPNGIPFLLQAVTGSPRTISSSASYVQVGPAPGNW